MEKRKSEFGVSLVELMIAALILIVGVMSIVNMFMKGTMNVVTTSNANEAMNLCRTKLEEVKMRQLDYASLITQPLPFPTSGTATIGSCKGTWTITIEGINDSTGQVTSPASGDYLRVTVEVGWQENIVHKRRLFTYIGNIS
ncbi:MAG: hypothetical protein AB1414_08315 [bacterium]